MRIGRLVEKKLGVGGYSEWAVIRSGRLIGRERTIKLLEQLYTKVEICSHFEMKLKDAGVVEVPANIEF